MAVDAFEPKRQNTVQPNLGVNVVRLGRGPPTALCSPPGFVAAGVGSACLCLSLSLCLSPRTGYFPPFFFFFLFLGGFNERKDS